MFVTFAVFAERAARLGYRILESRIPFPDYILGFGTKRVLAEAEFRTSDFLRHKHDLSRCDLIVVWDHDLPLMPIPVLELKSEKMHRPRRYAITPETEARTYGLSLNQ